MGKRNKPFVPIVNNSKMPYYNHKNSGCFNIITLGVSIGMLVILSAIGFGIYLIIRSPKEILICICFIVIFLLALGIISLIIDCIAKLFNIDS